MSKKVYQPRMELIKDNCTTDAWQEWGGCLMM